MMELTVEGVRKNYGRFCALKDITQTFQPGIYGLLGPNGAGKSTLMNIISGIIPSSGGHVRYNGHDIHSLGASYRKILGFMPQVIGYYRNFTARGFLEYIAALKDMKDKRANKIRIDEALEEVNLTGEANQKIGSFSGGMKQRLGIAQALLNDPKIVIFDEPTAGLDPKERIRFKNLLSRIAPNKIIILATHIVSDVESIADQIIFIRKGEIVLTGSVSECLTKVKERVYHISTKEKHVSSLIDQYKVVGMSAMGEHPYLRVVSEQTLPEGILQEHVTLEDVYLYYFGEDET